MLNVNYQVRINNFQDSTKEYIDEKLSKLNKLIKDYQIIAVNLFFFTYETFQLYLIQIAFNILLLSIVLKNTLAWLENKFIIEAQTHYIYDINSTFILFNSFWGGTIFLTSYSNPLLTAVVLFVLFIIVLLLSLLTNLDGSILTGLST